MKRKTVTQYINQLRNLRHKLRAYVVDSETQIIWQDALLRGISDATHQSIATTFIGSIRSSLRTISRTLNDFRRIPDLTDSSKIAMSHDIHTNIVTIMNSFSDNQSIFRLYPTGTVMPLTTLMSLVAVSYPILNEYVPEFENKLFVACELKDILIEYRRHLLYYRLRSLRSKNYYLEVGRRGSGGSRGTQSKDIYLGRSITEMIGRNSEADTNLRSSIRCLKTRWEGFFGYSIKDLVTGEKYYSRANLSCPIDYIELIRYEVTKAFEVSINTMERICTREVQNKRRKTGIRSLIYLVS